jgi:hypothetical protein
MLNVKRQTSNVVPPTHPRPLIRLISLWFILQVLINVLAATHLALHPTDEPVSLFSRLDLIVNTGLNAVLAAGFWRTRPWAWRGAVWFLPVYWFVHLWHLVVPEEGILLWPFLMVDAAVLAWLLGPHGRGAFSVPEGPFRKFSAIPPLMGAVALYAALAPLIGLFPALAAGFAVVFVGFSTRTRKSGVQNPRPSGKTDQRPGPGAQGPKSGETVPRPPRDF